MRSTRKRARVSYEEEDANELESEAVDDVIAPASSGFCIEKILGRKFVVNHENPSTPDEVFLIKWKGLSFLHISWEYRHDLERVDNQAKLKIKRFLTSQMPTEIFGDPSKVTELSDQTDDDDIEYFSHDLMEIGRIISCDIPSCRHSTCQSVEEILASDESELSIQYLVKWRGSPYCDCSWEKWGDIQSAVSEVFSFWKRQKGPKIPTRAVSHPSLQEYSRLVTSPQYGLHNEQGDDESGLVLRDYQLEGVNWLLWNWWHKRPCILADEMGLGKLISIHLLLFFHLFILSL